MANQKPMFAIVAGVSFAIPKFLMGAFNAYHISRGRLTKAGPVGTVTPAGALFFAQREGVAPTAKTLKEFADTCSAAKYPLTEKQGVQWPVGPNAIAWQAGQGVIGQSAFYYALCQLSQAAKQAAETAAKQAAKPAKQASKQGKPSEVKAGEGAAKTKAKPTTIKAKPKATVTASA